MNVVRSPVWIFRTCERLPAASEQPISLWAGVCTVRDPENNSCWPDVLSSARIPQSMLWPWPQNDGWLSTFGVCKSNPKSVLRLQKQLWTQSRQRKYRCKPTPGGAWVENWDVQNVREQLSETRSAASQHSLNSFHSDLSSVTIVNLVSVTWANRVAQWGSAS